MPSRVSDGGIFYPSREPIPLFRTAQRLGAYKFASFHHLVEHTMNTAHRHARRRELTTRSRHMFLHIVDHSAPRLPPARNSPLRPRRVAGRQVQKPSESHAVLAAAVNAAGVDRGFRYSRFHDEVPRRACVYPRSSERLTALENGASLNTCTC